MAASDNIDSNVTGLSIAEEASLGVLPGSPIWRDKEVNTYGDLGGDIKTVARETINNTRQNQKGTVVDLDAAGSFNIDFTQNNLTNELQGFMFADAHEKKDSAGLNVVATPFTAVDAIGGFTAASGITGYLLGDLVKTSGFADSANNDLGVVSVDSSSTVVDTDIASVVDASPLAAGRVEVVGFEFATSDVALTVVAGLATLTSSVKDMTELALKVGEWCFIGGDVAGSAFANGTGYFRVSAITATTLVFDKAAGLTVADTGTGKDIRIFFGVFQNNAKVAADIVTRSYNVERTLGNDGSGVQTEYLEGAVANEFALKLPVADKMVADLSFIAMDNVQRDGTTGPKSGSHVLALGEDAYNTSSHVYRIAMSVLDATTLTPTDLFEFIQNMDLNINNNITANKAIGTLGSIGITAGNFVTSGSFTAYFQTIAATQAVRNNSDVTVDAILAKNNAGWIIDIPLLGLSGGKVKVEKDQAITVDVDNQGAKNANDYTLGLNSFSYLPTVAMGS